jgi:hypothetical protein
VKKTEKQKHDSDRAERLARRSAVKSDAPSESEASEQDDDEQEPEKQEKEKQEKHTEKLLDVQVDTLQAQQIVLQVNFWICSL